MNDIKERVKKGIMYVKSNDYYFIAYNVILFLKITDCIYPKRYLKDYRKLQYLSEIVSDSRYLKIISKKSENISVNDKQMLARLYSNGLTRMSQLSQVLFFLESKDLISIQKNDNSKTFDVSLKAENIDKSFFSRDVFMNEIKNIYELKSQIHGLSNINYGTMLDKIFSDYGIAVWHI